VGRVVLNALAPRAAGSPVDIGLRRSGCHPLEDKTIHLFRIVDIGTPEFSLALRHFSGQLPLQIWPENENLIFENNFNAHASRRRSDAGKSLIAEAPAHHVTFITSAMATLTGKVQ